MAELSPIEQYAQEVSEQLLSGQAREHGYRPALERLMRSFQDVGATNDPKRSAYGNPDMIFYRKSNHDIILGYAEAKDIDVNLDRTIKTEQLHRYAGYNKLFLTNYLDFRFYRNGEEYLRLSLGQLIDDKIEFDEIQFNHFYDELQAFLELPPEPIKSGKSLALIMGQKARRIRDSVDFFLQRDSDKNQELEKIYEMMKQLLVRDLTKQKFADMYAQTLVYGLFAARYNDHRPDEFSRSQANELVPASNPFLREFFGHIGGIHFDKRLAIVVDELCAVLAVSNVDTLIHKHLRLFEVENEKDPIIHFYEDFLKEYDPLERKRMGAYYTPVPVVRYMIRQVDAILKQEFSIAQGLASSEKITKQVEVGQDMRHDRRRKLVTTQPKEFHRVQILDPAVGTATFLNETIKYIAQTFAGQEGRWPAYAAEDLLPRLNGFELMMAPYTIAHLKLAMTLQETGVDQLHNKRLGIYLTNTLEESIPGQMTLFDVGLAAAVTEESRLASEIKNDRPIMIVMGNPPYSVSSNNKSDYIEKLVKDYKRGVTERNIQPLSDDYIKFIRFAEEMITKNSEGIVAMITNNSYLDGVIHRQMREHLLNSFDKIYVLNLHGSSKQELDQPGAKDQNVFDIQQGVSIQIFIKTQASKPQPAELYYAEVIGSRKSKFDYLNQGDPVWQKLEPQTPHYFFAPKTFDNQTEYQAMTGLQDLFIVSNAGSATGKDSVLVADSPSKLRQQLIDANLNYDEELFTDYNYRLWDGRVTIYDKKLLQRLRTKVMDHLYQRENLALVTTKLLSSSEFKHVFVSDIIGDRCLISNRGKEANYFFPLYLYHDDGSRTVNFDSRTLKTFTANLSQNYAPETIFDYIYAVLHSPNYRQKYREFLKIDFPRLPAPANDAELKRLAVLGNQLRDLHLMRAVSLHNFDTTFPEPGNNQINKLSYSDNRVYINTAQYFGNVPASTWEFSIGGYQPAQKWLKDRKNQPLTNHDIEHYQKIVKILTETQALMKQIDEQRHEV